MSNIEPIVFHKYIHGCTEDHELMSNHELQQHVSEYYGLRVCGNSTFQEFTLYCTDEIVLETLKYCCRFGNFRVHNTEHPKMR